MAGARVIGRADGPGARNGRGLPLGRLRRKGGDAVNKELKRILTGVSVASLVAGAGAGLLGCAHGS